MLRRARAAAGVLGMALSGCSSFFEPEQFEPIVLYSSQWAAIQPAQPFDLWELRSVGPDLRHEVVASGGIRAREEIDPETLRTFDRFLVTSGFAQGCLPGHCFSYLISIQGTQIRTWTDPTGLAAFLGPIDAPIEALLLARGHDYYWSGELEAGAIRATGDGYELVVLKLVSACAPVQVNRYLLRVRASGEIRVLRNEVRDKNKEACI